ncbi:hypothetical protein U1Q18_036189, partial [Sarracenia purpurea var. burkii]
MVELSISRSVQQSKRACDFFASRSRAGIDGTMGQSSATAGQDCQSYSLVQSATDKVDQRQRLTDEYQIFFFDS